MGIYLRSLFLCILTLSRLAYVPEIIDKYLNLEENSKFMFSYLTQFQFKRYITQSIIALKGLLLVLGMFYA